MKRKKQIYFLGAAKTLMPLSLILAFFALAVIVSKGFVYGIDFAGGNEVQVRFQEDVTAQELRESLKKSGIKKSVVQSFGTDKEFLIRIEVSKGETENNATLKTFVSTLKEGFKSQGAEIRRVDSVGPQIGEELRRNGILAVLYSLLMILIYLGLRFDSKYAPSAVFCLFHDAMITMVLFSIFNLEVNVQTLAAILAIIGYSLNDTIVTFDRIRENQQLFSGKKPFAEICNSSLNDVFSRTLLTSITTLLAVGTMWLFADGVIRDFAFTLGFGVVIGTYSSIYVATPLLLFFNRFEFFKSN